MSSSRPSSSATSGFFQEKPRLANQYVEDATYRRIIGLFIPQDEAHSLAEELHGWGERVLSRQVLRWLADAEAHPPRLILRDSFGSPRNELITSEGWRNLQNLGIREGIVAMGYENRQGVYSRTAQFLKMFLWCGSSSTVTCPSAMQDGAAALIRHQLRDSSSMDLATYEALKSAYERLTSREPGFAWTSGQWMTERSGGSDVSRTETRAQDTTATPSRLTDTLASDGTMLGPWSVDGFKWFSSATDADMTLLLAKTEDSDRVSLFFAPTRLRRKIVSPSTGREEQIIEFNGIKPQRLKNKLGTRALPTAELELEGMRAFLVGKEGQGVKEISTVLNVTRIYNCVSAVGAMGRGLAISRAFARVRRAAGGSLLTDVPAHVRGMAVQHVEYRGSTMLAFFLVHLLGITESAQDSTDLQMIESSTEAAQLLRLLTPVAKATTALASIDGLRFSMESLGGLGYLENEDIEFNVAKLLRDTNVLSIWEGTTDVMAADMVRVLKGHGGDDIIVALQKWVKRRLGEDSVQQSGLGTACIIHQLGKLLAFVADRGVPELLYHGRHIVGHLSWIVTATLLVVDAARDQDRTAQEIAKRWLAKRCPNSVGIIDNRNWCDEARLDREIVFSKTFSML